MRCMIVEQDQRDIEFLDEVPEGFVPSMMSAHLEGLGIEKRARRWLREDGIQGADMYVPEWAHRVMVAMMLTGSSAATIEVTSLRDDAVRVLGKLPAEQREAALTVLDLGGLRAFIEHVLGTRSDQGSP